MAIKEVKQKIWLDEAYYSRIAASERFSHPGFLKAQRLCLNAVNILDVGCGDGSKLARLGNKDTKRNGAEVSSQAINRGERKFPDIKFHLLISMKLPFANKHFDRVTSFFVLEHTSNPGKLVDEAVRVCKRDGLIIFLAPNFGAPNRASPNYQGSRWLKLAKGLVNDFSPNKTKLSWQKVNPTIASMNEFQPDLDTTVEPYLNSLIDYLKAKGLVIMDSQTYWEMELPHPKWWQKMFRFLGKIGVYPFKYWGPHLFIVARKR